MINVLSYIGMNVQSEVCLWTLLGLIRTIFDATLFRVNANLKQVWQMSMPEELSMPVQRVLRTMISGVMLVQCFTVYVYLASYIVLLYPVFLEERPTLVLPWLLLAAVRKLLCELTSLALGLGTCVLLGPTRPPCIKFVIIKLISIMPAFYTWMLLFSYYHSLKVAAAFKTFPAVIPPGDKDYGLELAVRRRRTKSLLGEDQLRSKLVASLYGERHAISGLATKLSKVGISSRMLHSSDTISIDDIEGEALRPNSLISNQMSETGYEDWFGSEVVLPRGSDRILEQFVLMLLRIRAYLDKEGQGMQGFSSDMFTSKSSHPNLTTRSNNLTNATISEDDTDTPFQVGSSKGKTASYLQEYPQIFMKKSVDVPRNDNNVGKINVQTRQLNESDGNTLRPRRRTVTVSSKEKILLDDEGVVNNKKYTSGDKTNRQSSSGQSTSKQRLSNSEEIKNNDVSNNNIPEHNDNNLQQGQIIYQRHHENIEASSNHQNVEQENSSTSSSNEPNDNVTEKDKENK